MCVRRREGQQSAHDLTGGKLHAHGLLYTNTRMRIIEPYLNLSAAVHGHQHFKSWTAPTTGGCTDTGVQHDALPTQSINTNTRHVYGKIKV